MERSVSAAEYGHSWHVDQTIGIKFDPNGGTVRMIGENYITICWFRQFFHNRGAIDHRHSGTVQQAVWKV